jgi:uncharacterized repeat protein (TIGR03803 family)
MKQHLWRTLPLALVAFVFSFSTAARAQYTETIVHNFTGSPDGLGPSDILTFDASGNFYGTTGFGGANNDGMVYEFSPSSGGWSESTLFSFPAGSGGSDPFSGVIFDAAGNLYGTSLEAPVGVWSMNYPLVPAVAGLNLCFTSFKVERTAENPYATWCSMRAAPSMG